jgi:hypothetical protein
MRPSIEHVEKEIGKMKKASWLVIGALTLVLAGTVWLAARANAQPGAGESQSVPTEPIQIAQFPPGAVPGGGFGDREGPRQMTREEMEKMRQQMIERMLDESGLTDNEQAAAKETLRVKQQARATLEGALTQLRRAANKAKPSDKELREALAAYRAALAQYRAKVESADQALTRQLSLRGQVRCMSLGILDNGLGGMGPGLTGPPGGMPRQGGPGGGWPGR